MDQIALLDLDGTVADFFGAMRRDLVEIAAPGELVPQDFDPDVQPHIRARRHMIMKQPGWWRKLEPTTYGMAIVKLLRKHGYSLHVLTRGPYNPIAWAEKVEWCHEHLPDAKITITEDKGLVYGKILVDDYPPYVLRWLKHRPRGLAILPHHSYNADLEHPSVFRYKGSGDDEKLSEVLSELNKSRDGPLTLQELSEAFRRRPEVKEDLPEGWVDPPV